MMRMHNINPWFNVWSMFSDPIEFVSCFLGVPQEQRAGLRREGQGPRLHRGDWQGTICPLYCVKFYQFRS